MEQDTDALRGIGCQAMKKRIVVAATFLAGLYFFLEYLIPNSWQTVTTSSGAKVRILSDYAKNVSDYLLVVLTFALGLGWANLLGGMWKKLAGFRKDWFAALIFFLGVVTTLVIGFWYEEVARVYAAQDPFAAGSPMHWLSSVWSVIRDDVNSSLVASVFSLLAFYMASAAYRAFKLKNIDGTLMMVAAFIIMLGNVPLGNFFTAKAPMNLQIPTWSMWIMNYINSPASRALNFGIAVGILAISLRLWLSIERGSFFEREL
jgi:hypothetical protein